MEHRVDPGAEHGLRVAGDRATVEGGRGGDGVLVAGGKVIQDRDVVAVVGELGRDDAADVPGAPGDQQPHPASSSRSVAAAVSGRMSLANAPMPDSEPARYFSLPGARRIVNSSRCSANSGLPARTGA